jgi:hypothetical protein
MSMTPKQRYSYVRSVQKARSQIFDVQCKLAGLGNPEVIREVDNIFNALARVEEKIMRLPAFGEDPETE